MLEAELRESTSNINLLSLEIGLSDQQITSACHQETNVVRTHD